jgi:hypothetical protein
MGGHWDRNSTLFGLLESVSETENIVRSCSTLLATALVSLMLSGCLFIPIPIGRVYSPATAYQKPEGSVTSPEEAMTAPPTPLPSTPDGKLAAKKEHQESVNKRQEPVGCKEQA